LDWPRACEVDARRKHNEALRRYFIRISFLTSKTEQIILQGCQAQAMAAPSNG
jgi:hypothetical protein